MLRRPLSIIVALACLGATQARAETNVLFIVDGSNSMWGQIDNTAKIETAKETLSKLVTDLPADANLALMAYGHTREKDCNDVELLSALGKDTPEMISTLIHTIQPKGKTPIANALMKSKDVFKGREGQNNHILLVSDGIESCDGDPCAVAKDLQEAGLSVSAHVIGFGVSKEEGKQLTCIAENTGGKYFDAANAAAFNDAIKEVTELAQVEPEPEPVNTVIFEDTFDGAALAPHWDILNPNTEQYIVENGDLLLIGKDAGGLNNTESSNILQLMEDLPAGDWTITVELTPEFQTSSDLFSFGLYTDNENYVAASLVGHDSFCCDTGSIGYAAVLTTEKMSGGEQTKFETPFAGPSFSPNHSFKEYIEEWGKTNVKTTVQLVKEGRSYKSRLHQDGKNDDDGNPIWLETDVVTSLRAPKQFVINAGQTKASDGESMLTVHSVKIESQK